MMVRIIRQSALLIAFFILLAYGVGLSIYHWPPFSAPEAGDVVLEQDLDNPQQPIEEQQYSCLLSAAAQLPPLNVPDFSSSAEFIVWQRTQRRAFTERMLCPYPGELGIEEEALVEKEGFSQQTFEVTFQGERLFRYFRLVPEGVRASERLPAIVCFMGHGDVQQILDDVDSYQHALAAAFARAGYLVYAMENIGMEPGQDTHRDLDQALRLTGQSWYSLLFAHQRIMLDQVFADPSVDPERVGAAGVSTGGLLALTAAVQEPRIAAASVQGIFGSMRVSFIRDRLLHCPCGAITGLLPDFDLPELALLVAPRSLHIANGEHDTFSPEEAQRCLDLMELVLRKLALPLPEFTVSPGGHEFDVSSALRFFDKHLE